GESLAADQVTAGEVGDGERVAVALIGEHELTLVIGAPQIVWHDVHHRSGRVRTMRCRNGAPLAKRIRCVLLVSAGMGFGGYLGARESMQITYTSIRVVDYHDQLEL